MNWRCTWRSRRAETTSRRGCCTTGPIVINSRGWRGDTPDVQALVVEAAAATGAQHVQVLLILAARFRRLSWRYESMAVRHRSQGRRSPLPDLLSRGDRDGTRRLCSRRGGCGLLRPRRGGRRTLDETSVGEFRLAGSAAEPKARASLSAAHRDLRSMASRSGRPPTGSCPSRGKSA